MEHIQDLVYDQKRIQKTEHLVSLGTLSASWMHELKQPLSVIQLAVENVLAEVEGQDCQDAVRVCLADVQVSLDVFKQTLGRFRSFVRQPENESPQLVDWAEVVEEVIALLKPTAQQSRMRFSHEGLACLPKVNAVRYDLVQLFYSLLENSIQAAQGAGHQVSIEGRGSQERVQICVTDDCGGIAPDCEKRIFEPFFTTRSTEMNTGLGLTVVQRIVQRLRGRLSLKNRFGQGVSFYIDVPVSDY